MFRAIKFNTILKHVIVWLFVYCYIFWFGPLRNFSLDNFIFSSLFILAPILTYYFLEKLIFPVAVQKQYGLVIIGFFISFFVLVGIDLLNFKIILPICEIPTPRDKLDVQGFIKRSLYWYFLTGVFAYGRMVLLLNAINSRTALQSAEERLSFEFSILKNQFHSHLTFNFMNYCYTQLIEVSEYSAAAVEHYSEMLRYTLRFQSIQFININDEIEYLNHFLKLQYYLSSFVYYEFEVDSDDKEYYISPMILGLLVEHAFKYGCINDKQKPIQLKLDILNFDLTFKICYHLDKNSEMENATTSIDELYNRIKLLYPESKLDQLIQTNDGKFIFCFNAKLNDKD